MSRLGKSPIELPKNVEVKIQDKKVLVKGPKGSLEFPSTTGLKVRIEEGRLFVEFDEGVEVTGVIHGLYRASINNMVTGVSKGFEKRLTLIGVGYRAALQGHHLDLQLGYSHPTKLEIPKTVQVEVEKSTTIIIRGVDKQAVGQFAAMVRGKRPPEPYKGKGIRYENEHVRKKAGKAAKGKAA
ncbi:MAG: 50S ribosomal protein L6 [Simkania sp.]|nr:50S ribosomal protein L6 [Simkania sp.]